MRLIDADALGNRMYHESFEKDSDLQKWDSGCWIRYKLFEQVLREAPTIDLTHPTPSNTLGALDCVSREDLTKGIETYFGDLPITVHYDMLALAQKLPSVQPEGIRCKDCKHWMMGKTTKNYPNPYICELHSFMHGFERSALPEDYCSWAELRGDSDEND